MCLCCNVRKTKLWYPNGTVPFCSDGRPDGRPGGNGGWCLQCPINLRTYCWQNAVTPGDPKSRNDETVEWWNHGTAENNPKSLKTKSRNGGTAENDSKSWKMESRNSGTVENYSKSLKPESRNGRKSPEILRDRISEMRKGGKSPEILKDGMMENHPISQKREM